MSDCEHKYTKTDLDTIILQVCAIMDFAELLADNRNNDEQGAVPPSIALIIKTLIEPVIDFLQWAAVYAELPKEDSPGAGLGA